MPPTRVSASAWPPSTRCPTPAPYALADQPRPTAGRPRWWAVGLSLVLLVVVGLITWRLASPDDEPYVASPPDQAANSISPAHASLTLERLQRAIQRGDRDAATALAAPDDLTAQTQLVALVDNATAAHIDDLSFRYVDEQEGLGADSTWTAAVETTWRFDGFDEAAARTEVLFRFRAGADSVRVAGVGGSALRTPVWMSGPLDIRRTSQVLVMVSPEAGRLTTYARLADRAEREVRRVVTAWRPRLVIEVPSGLDALAQAIDASPSAYEQIAAVTTSSDGSTAPGSPVHVFVNAGFFRSHGEVGNQVVMTHEVTHLATDAPRSKGPTWLVEGYADYVALRDVDLPLSQTARQIGQQVVRNGLPDALPTAAEFDTNGPHLGAVYEASWLLCRSLATRGGERTLTRFYDAVSDGADLDVQLRKRFDWSERDLLRAWQARLSDLQRDRT